jgi:hypothetical protein
LAPGVLGGKERQWFGSGKWVFVIGDQGAKGLLVGLLSGDVPRWDAQWPAEPKLGLAGGQSVRQPLRQVAHEKRPGREAPSYQAGMSTNANGLAVRAWILGTRLGQHAVRAVGSGIYETKS